MFCSKCGKENLEDARFCQDCGNELNYNSNQYSAKHNESSDYESKMLEAFIDTPKKFEWYKEAFKRFDQADSTKMIWYWSWYGFFFNIYFLAYRKAYYNAFILFIVSTLFSLINFIIIPSTIGNSGIGTALSMTTSILFAIFTGGYSTYFIYKNYKFKKLNTEKQYQTESQRIEAIKTIGGVNKWIVLIILVVSALISLLLMSFTGNLGGAKYPQEVKQNFISQCETNPNTSYASCECLINKIENKIDYKTFLAADTQYIQGINGPERDKVQLIINESAPLCRGL